MMRTDSRWCFLRRRSGSKLGRPRRWLHSTEVATCQSTAHRAYCRGQLSYLVHHIRRLLGGRRRDALGFLARRFPFIRRRRPPARPGRRAGRASGAAAERGRRSRAASTLRPGDVAPRRFSAPASCGTRRAAQYLAARQRQAQFFLPHREPARCTFDPSLTRAPSAATRSSGPPRFSNSSSAGMASRSPSSPAAWAAAMRS